MDISDFAEDYLVDHKDGMRKLTAWLLNEVMQQEALDQISGSAVYRANANLQQFWHATYQGQTLVSIQEIIDYKIVMRENMAEESVTQRNPQFIPKLKGKKVIIRLVSGGQPVTGLHSIKI